MCPPEGEGTAQCTWLTSDEKWRWSLSLCCDQDHISQAHTRPSQDVWLPLDVIMEQDSVSSHQHEWRQPQFDPLGFFLPIPIFRKTKITKCISDQFSNGPHALDRCTVIDLARLRREAAIMAHYHIMAVQWCHNLFNKYNHVKVDEAGHEAITYISYKLYPVLLFLWLCPNKFLFDPSVTALQPALPPSVSAAAATPLF